MNHNVALLTWKCSQLSRVSVGSLCSASSPSQLFSSKKRGGSSWNSSSSLKVSSRVKESLSPSCGRAEWD